jgi:hypothetical protein
MADCDSYGPSHGDLSQGNVVQHASAINSSLNAPGWGQAFSIAANDNSIISQNLVYYNYAEGTGVRESPGVVDSC